jgi:Fe-S oxidoreductase
MKMSAEESLLHRIGIDFQSPAPGCCGMAGSFGYSKKLYDVSTSIANRRLLPAAKAMQNGDALVAPGTSCRHQVADLAGVEAVHPAVLIRSLLDPIQ